MADDRWSGWRDRLAAELATLSESEFVIFDHDVPPEMQRWSQPRRGLFRTKPPARLPSGFLAQFAGQGQGCVIGTLAGATLVGGHVEVTEEQDARIRGLGWKGPGDPGHYENYAPEYTVVDWPQSDAAGLARITVDALEVQGADPELAWHLRRDS
jgi:hypothetical protein